MSDRPRKYILSLSGGKDSVAAWIFCRLDLCLPVEAVFADTGWEAPQTAAYMAYLRTTALGDFATVRGTMAQLRKDLPDEPLDMLRLAQHKRRWPSSMARFCTSELKLRPIREYVRRRVAEEPGTDFIMVSGVRADESPRRAQLPERGHDEYMGIERWLPIHRWSVDDVFALHRKHGIDPNPLYKMGMKRVGCWPCIMSNKGELREIARRFPERFDDLIQIERLVKPKNGAPAAFFPPNKVPECLRDLAGDKGGTYASASVVRAWALDADDPAQAKFDFAPEGGCDADGDDPEAEACSSPYGLCE